MIKSSIVMLHNSWTPSEFKSMTKEEFLSCDCTLSNILSSALCLSVYKVNNYNKIQLKNLANKFDMLTRSVELSDKIKSERNAQLYDEIYAYSNRFSIYSSYYFVKTIRQVVCYFFPEFLRDRYLLNLKKVKLIRDFKRRISRAVFND